MQKFCLALDLKKEEAAITAYEKYHTQVWPEVIESIVASGITQMEIYRIETRLIMIIEATDEFSFAQKSAMDATNTKVQAWETLMNEFQQPLSSAHPDEKWILMNKIFDLEKYL